MERLLVERILASPQFEKTSRLRDLLKYITGQAWTGDVGSLKEQAIGHAVFKRPGIYDPVGDNIVRVQARQLRQKLEEYFETGGKDELLVLEIPRGKYLPVFRRRELAAPAVEAARPWGWLRLRPVIGGVLVCAVAVLLVRAGMMLSGPAAPRHEIGWPWTELRGDHLRTLIVVADPTLAFLRKLTGREVQLQDYAKPNYPLFLLSPDAPQSVKDLFAMTSSQRTTSQADLMVATEIVRLFGWDPNRPVIRLARELQYRELQENNVILIGTAWGSNPWAELFERELNFVPRRRRGRSIRCSVT